MATSKHRKRELLAPTIRHQHRKFVKKQDKLAINSCIQLRHDDGSERRKTYGQMQMAWFLRYWAFHFQWKLVSHANPEMKSHKQLDV